MENRYLAGILAGLLFVGALNAEGDVKPAASKVANKSFVQEYEQYLILAGVGAGCAAATGLTSYFVAASKLKNERADKLISKSDLIAKLNNAKEHMKAKDGEGKRKEVAEKITAVDKEITALGTAIAAIKDPAGAGKAEKDAKDKELAAKQAEKANLDAMALVKDAATFKDFGKDLVKNAAKKLVEKDAVVDKILEDMAK